MMLYGRSTDTNTPHDAKYGLSRRDTLHVYVGNSRQAPKQSYLSRTSSSAGLRGTVPGVRASMMKGGRAPKAPAEIPLGTSQRVWMPLPLCCACSQMTMFALLPIMVRSRLALCKLLPPLLPCDAASFVGLPIIELPAGTVHEHWQH